MTDNTQSLSQRRALLVEDSPVNRQVMGKLLEKLGYKVTVAKNGREAVTTFVANEFDVVLMDVQMPIMDGLAATQIIRQHEFATGRRTPIIAVTAGMDRESCMEAGMDDHLVKPVLAQTLKVALRQVTMSKSEL